MTTVRLFEHETLKVGALPGGGAFTEGQWDALIRWQERQQATYFTVVHRGIKLSQWVGVLQVGSLTLEILPKAEPDRQVPRDALVTKWKTILYRMLNVAHNLDLKVVNEASVKLQQHTLLDLIFERFLDHAEALMAQGLIKAYRQVSANRRAVRGRLLVGRNEALNAIHRERIYTQATEYDRNNLWNQILFVATQVTAQRARQAGLRSRAKALELFLPEQNPRLDLAAFDHLNYTRRTEAYRPAMRYAELVLRRTSPDLQGGVNDVFALLFDMNRLWESWVLSKVRQQLSSVPHGQVTGQSIMSFWDSPQVHKVVKPDILIRYRDGRPPIVMDAKWKVLSRCEPADDDLKQMYVYEKLLGVITSTLVYPQVHLSGRFQGSYTDAGHSLQMLFLDPEDRNPDFSLSL